MLYTFQRSILLILVLAAVHLWCQEAVSRQFIIHFAENPRDRDQHKEWTTVVEEAIEMANDRLIQDGYLSPADQHIKKHRIHFIRKDHDFGHFTVRIPDNLSSDIFVRYLNQVFDKKKIPFHITPDAPVILAQRPATQFSVETLHQLKTGMTIIQEEATLQKITDRKKKKEQEQKIAFLKKVQKLLYWYQEFPTTGLRFPQDHQITYPFLPHIFTLWDLAPHQGSGIKIGVLDSGIAAFTLKEEPEVRKNQDLFMRGDFAHYNYNVVSDDGLDPLHELIDLMRGYIAKDKFDHKELEQLLPVWIKEFVLYKRDGALRAYIQKNGKKEFIDAQGNLTSRGMEAIDNITSGPDGIAPEGESPRFTINDSINPPQRDVIVEFMPLEVQRLGHGSHVASVITGGLQNQTIDQDTGIVGLAPRAETVMIKIFGERGAAQSSTILAGMNKAIEYNVDILNLSLGIDTSGYTSESEKLFEAPLCSIAYVIAATGNEGIATETFPARCTYIPFDIGAFDAAGDIPPFSRYERGRGPRFVAPGVAILGAFTSRYQTEDSWYGLLEGTSAATPVVAGFIALMLGEFKNDFSRDQLLSVCYVSGIKLKNTRSWQQKTLLGVLDMRTALFTLHVLNKIRQLKQKDQTFSFDIHFERLLKAVNYLLFAMPQYYADQHLKSINFKDNFMEYVHAAQKNGGVFDQWKQDTFFMPTTVIEAVQKIADAVLGSMNEKESAALSWLPEALRRELKK